MLGAEDSRHTEFLLDSFFRGCRHYLIDFQGFNIGLHKDIIEIYVAHEHNYGHYVGSMGCEAKTQEEVWKFLNDVRAELEISLDW